MNQYCFLSLKRSGHHAIINWAMNHFSNCYFINNILEEQKYYFATSDFKKKIQTTNFFCNIEDFHIDKDKLFDIGLGFYNLKNFYIFRNPFNLMASRLKNKNIPENIKNIDKCKFLLEKWKEYAKKYLSGEKNYFVYDKWFYSKKYRDEIAKNIGFNNNEKHLDEVSHFGEGSSFDKLKYNGIAQKMNVLTRYEYYEENNDFLNLFDDEILELTNKIFDNKNIPKKFKKNITFL